MNRTLRSSFAAAAGLTLLLTATFVVSLTLGVADVSWSQLPYLLFGGGDVGDQLVIFQIRMPRAAVAMLVGAGLAVAGTLLQGLSRNDLASPATVGVEAGSGLGLMLLIVVMPTVAARHPIFAPLASIAGALAIAALVFTLAYREGSILPARLLLVGIAVGYGIQAAMLMLSLRMNYVTYSHVLNWMSGSLSSADWSSARMLAIPLAAVALLAYGRAQVLNVMAIGDEAASSLGVAVHRERLTMIALAGLLTSLCAAVAGQIGFIGLVAPHLARKLVGGDYRAVIPVSGLCGALLLLLGDSLGRHFFRSVELPAGVFVGVLGGGYFLYLLATTKN
ncbi:FecCD family ABC transporter permease [Lacipirellula sp.]|uniref:FecCD family ABC transporter permease n=1 Tax=Lacipirellula sp. TaxID=2691419 RepID=UPI003D0BC693